MLNLRPASLRHYVVGIVVQATHVTMGGYRQTLWTYLLYISQTSKDDVRAIKLINMHQMMIINLTVNNNYG